ncbi:ASCH domain-containing protein [Aeropyrum pernix]|nr:ASCH domain-containing protein [Aeropyrum pernix]
MSNGEKRRRVQYLGRHIMIKGVYADKLLEGRKTTTIRLGIVKPRYREVIIHGHGRPLAKAEIVDVHVKKVSELTLEDARRDGFRSVRELIESLERVYGYKLDPEDAVTIIHLRVKQRFDNLDLSDPYLGLEPADIARLGLRYLGDSLSDEEKRVLEDLTRTNSIRATAVRLYGSIERRGRVRRVLRRVLQELLRRGLIKGEK